MLTAILFTIFGLVIGQFLKVDIDPKAIATIKQLWAIALVKVPEAIEWFRMGPLQKRIREEFAKYEELTTELTDEQAEAVLPPVLKTPKPKA